MIHKTGSVKLLGFTNPPVPFRESLVPWGCLEVFMINTLVVQRVWLTHYLFPNREICLELFI